MPWPKPRCGARVGSSRGGRAPRSAPGRGWPRQAHQHLLAGGDLDAVEHDGLGGHAEGGVRHGGVEAQQLLDRGGDLVEVGDEGAELVGVVEQGHHAVADEAAGRVVAGDHELEQARQHLLAGELLALAGGDQHAHEVVGRLGLRWSTRSPR